MEERGMVVEHLKRTLYKLQKIQGCVLFFSVLDAHRKTGFRPVFQILDAQGTTWRRQLRASRLQLRQQQFGDNQPKSLISSQQFI